MRLLHGRFWIVAERFSELHRVGASLGNAKSRRRPAVALSTVLPCNARQGFRVLYQKGVTKRDRFTIEVSRLIVGAGMDQVEPARNLRAKILNCRIALEPERDTLGSGTRIQHVDEHLRIVAVAFCGRDAEDFGIKLALSVQRS